MEDSVKRQKVEKIGKEDWFIYLETPESEAEWDVDSFDGREYESDPEERELFSNEQDYNEYRLLKREFIDSKGFVYEPLSGNYPVQDLEALVAENVTVREWMADLANLCVNKSNEEKGTSVELVEVVRVIESFGAKRKAYITFLARENDNGPLVEYNAKVVTYIDKSKPPVPILCRPSPISSI